MNGPMISIPDETRSQLREISKMDEEASGDAYSEVLAYVVDQHLSALQAHEEAVSAKQDELAEKISGSPNTDSNTSSAALSEDQEVAQEQEKVADKLFD